MVIADICPGYPWKSKSQKLKIINNLKNILKKYKYFENLFKNNLENIYKIIIRNIFQTNFYLSL